VPSLAAGESGHSPAHDVNVGNPRDTGHSTELKPLAALADLRTFNHFVRHFDRPPAQVLN
jgi:hypothetical protein